MKSFKTRALGALNFIGWCVLLLFAAFAGIVFVGYGKWGLLVAGVLYALMLLVPRAVHALMMAFSEQEAFFAHVGPKAVTFGLAYGVAHQAIITFCPVYDGATGAGALVFWMMAFALHGVLWAPYRRAVVVHPA